MSSFTGVAKPSEAVEVGRYVGQGPQSIDVRIQTSESILLTFLRNRGGVFSAVVSDLDTSIKNDDTTYNGDGSTVNFSGAALTGPVTPGSLRVQGLSVPDLKDFIRDGRLFLDGQPRKRAASGTFAAMAGESMVVKTEDGALQTITFGTETTIAEAVATINTQAKGFEAVAQGAQDVDLLSLASGVEDGRGGYGGTTGFNPIVASIEVVSVDAGITTKLGISTGAETSEAGTIDYFTGDLVLAYPGDYAPAAGDILADYISTQSLDGVLHTSFSLPNLLSDDELILLATSQSLASELSIKVNQIAR